MTFNDELAAFQTWARNVSPEFAAQVDKVVSNNYLSQLGEMTVEPLTGRTPAMTTADKLGDLVNSVSSAYLNSVSAYYNAKQKVADLKLAAKGSPSTQLVNTAQGAIAVPPSNMLLFGGLGLLAVLMLSRR